MIDFLATRRRRKLLFAALYLSEGAPIGFLWLALPTRLRSAGVAIEEITWLTALLVLPWTFKFAWAPLVDVLRSPRWTLKHWIITCQCLMAVFLLPLVWMDAANQFRLLAWCLVAHAMAAATQDVAIDALCISVTEPDERGEYNGWMQAGMLLGRASMGGGALVIGRYLGEASVVPLLVVIISLSMAKLLPTRVPREEIHTGTVERMQILVRTLVEALRSRTTWFGLAFAATGGAAFKALEVIYGPFLIDRQYSQDQIGWFSAGPMIAAMLVGSLVGGYLSDRVGRRRFVALASVWIVMGVSSLAASDMLMGGTRGDHLLWMLAFTAFGIGLFTAASYALFMDITQPEIAATQFSAYMGATNACEAWSVYASGKIITARGYPASMLVMSALALLALPLLAVLPKRQSTEPRP